jgi:hypothetical protein
VVEDQQQYRGWYKELPAASAVDEATQLALILCQFAAVDPRHVQRVLTEKSYFEQTAAEALRRTHADTGSGNTTEFQRALDARNRLRKLKGWA